MIIRWRKLSVKNLYNEPEELAFVGVINHDIWCFMQKDECIKCRIYSNNYHITSEVFKEKFNDYFRANEDIINHKARWESSDERIIPLLKKYAGLRIMCQDPMENIFSFICSSNNNISRISQMVDKLCLKYGKELGNVHGMTHYAFPTVDRLAHVGVEPELRALGFGYRAKYIHQAARYICDREKEWRKCNEITWLEHLKCELRYCEAWEELLKIPGIGPKVADCVCLMSLNKMDAVPIDTHVWQVAKRHYMPDLANHKSLTTKLYRNIGNFFRNLYGEYAGWAHSYLFTSDLATFSDKNKAATNHKRKRSKV